MRDGNVRFSYRPRFAPERTRKQSSERDADWLIVQEVQEGRVGAFDQLVSKYRESIFSIIYNLTGNREDASVLQITFIKAFQAIGRFRGRSAFFTWLYRIALNTTMSFLKKHSKRRFINAMKPSMSLPVPQRL